MYNLASKLLAPLFDPLALAIMLAVCALLTWKHRRLATRLLVVAVVLLLAFSSKLVSGALVRSLEDQYQDSGLDVPPPQAIVVLGGTIRMPTAGHHLTGLIDPSAQRRSFSIRSRGIALIRLRCPWPFALSQARTSLSMRNEICDLRR